MERCDPPACVRPIGHAGDCRPNYWSKPICGAWLPYVKEPCVRTVGHRGSHRSHWALQYDRERCAKRRAAA